MAIGAVFLSVPSAALCSLFFSILHGLSVEQSLVLYSTSGFLTLLVFLLTNGLNVGAKRHSH